MRKLTLKKLTEAQACGDAKYVFRRLFPKGTFLSKTDQQRIIKYANKHYYRNIMNDWVSWGKWKMLTMEQREKVTIEWCGLEISLASFAKAWRAK